VFSGVGSIGSKVVYIHQSIRAFLIVALVMTSFLGYTKNASSVSSTTLILKAQFDCYVSENNPESCYGREVILNVRSYSNDGDHFNHRTYIMFDVSGLSKNIQIVSALLWLYKNPEGANPGVRNIQAFRVTSAWNEITLDWNNQPSVSSQPTASARVGGPMKWYSWDLTQDVIAWHKGSAINHGTMLKDEFKDSVTDYASVFLSREATHPENPYLEIKYNELPLETLTTPQGHTTTFQIVNNQAAWTPVIMIATLTILASLTWIMLRRRRDKEPRSEAKKLSFVSIHRFEQYSQRLFLQLFEILSERSESIASKRF
jgi:hypothetical protein